VAKLGVVALLVVLGAIACESALASPAPSEQPETTWIPDARITGFAVTPDRLIATGLFTSWGRNVGAAPTSRETTGEYITTSARVDGDQVHAAEDGAGGWYVVGYKLLVNGEETSGLIRIGADGRVDEEFRAPPIDWEGSSLTRITAFAGRLYVAGWFHSVGGVVRHSIAAFDATTGALDATFKPEFDCPPAVNSITVDEGSLLLAGAFREGDQCDVSSYVENSVARVDARTGARLTEAKVVVPNWQGATAAVTHGDDLYVVGPFGTVNGVARAGIAKVDRKTGEVDPNWGPTISGFPQAVVVAAGRVIVGGRAQATGDPYVVTPLTAVDESSGEYDPEWCGPAPGGVNEMRLVGTRLYVAGYGSLCGERSRGVVILDVSTGEDVGAPALRVGGEALSVAVGDESLMTTGTFTALDEAATPQVVTLDPHTLAVHTDWGPDAVSGAPRLVTDGDRLYAYGAFTKWGEREAPVLKIDAATGQVDDHFVAEGIVPHSDIKAVALGGNVLYVDVFLHGLVALDADTGKRLTSFTYTRDVDTVAVGPHGLYVNYQGVLHRLDPCTGERDPAFAAYSRDAEEIVPWRDELLTAEFPDGPLLIDARTGATDKSWPFLAAEWPYGRRLTLDGDTLFLGGTPHLADVSPAYRDETVGVIDMPTRTRIPWHPRLLSKGMLGVTDEFVFADAISVAERAYGGFAVFRHAGEAGTVLPPVQVPSCELAPEVMPGPGSDTGGSPGSGSSEPGSGSDGSDAVDPPTHDPSGADDSSQQSHEQTHTETSQPGGSQTTPPESTIPSRSAASVIATRAAKRVADAIADRGMPGVRSRRALKVPLRVRRGGRIVTRASWAGALVFSGATDLPAASHTLRARVGRRTPPSRGCVRISVLSRADVAGASVTRRASSRVCPRGRR
jgi:hypothetical protein